jgi:DNA-binding NtrC family response regulator
MGGSEILFVDDDRAILEMVREYLSEVGYRVVVVDNGARALDLLKDRPFEVVFSDIKMPDIDGLELLQAIKEYRPETEVIMVTGHGSMESAIQAMKRGSYDYIQKPFKLNVLKDLLDRIFEEKKLRAGRETPKRRVKDRHRFDVLVGISPGMQRVFDTLEGLQKGAAGVLIHGESGTGKALTAQVIHRTGGRGHKPFLPVNCKGLVRGGAAARLQEVLETAREGTVFLDDICDLPPTAQAALRHTLRGRPGGGGAAPRLIAATQRDAEEAVAKGLLDPELVAVLAEVSIAMPPLRERKEDICLLIQHFLNGFNAGRAKKVLAVDPEAMDFLLGYSWPGNVIQLENVIERAFALGVEWVIQTDDLPEEIRTAGEISRMQ